MHVSSDDERPLEYAFMCIRTGHIEEVGVQYIMSCLIISYHISSYHTEVLKWRKYLKVGTDKPKLEVKMQSVSNDNNVPEKEARCLLLWQTISICALPAANVA